MRKEATLKQLGHFVPHTSIGGTKYIYPTCSHALDSSDVLPQAHHSLQPRVFFLTLAAWTQCAQDPWSRRGFSRDTPWVHNRPSVNQSITNFHFLNQIRRRSRLSRTHLTSRTHGPSTPSNRGFLREVQLVSLCRTGSPGVARVLHGFVYLPTTTNQECTQGCLGIIELSWTLFEV